MINKIYIIFMVILGRVSCNILGSVVIRNTDARKELLDKVERIHTVLKEGYDLVSRNSLTVAQGYKSYRHVSVMTYKMPSDVTVAQFTFQVEDVMSGGFGKCQPEDVLIHLKYGSVPAVNPDLYPFPKGFIEESRREKIHTITLRSSYDHLIHNIINPKAGDWYAITYLRWEKSPKIEQNDWQRCPENPPTKNKFQYLDCVSMLDGQNVTPSYFICQSCLAAECDAVVYTDLQVKRSRAIMIDCYSVITLHLNDVLNMYKCMTTDRISQLTLKMKVNSGPNVKKATIMIQAINLPSTKSHLTRCYVNLPTEKFLSFSFQPHPNSWHYIVIEVTHDDASATECGTNANFGLELKKGAKSAPIIELVKENKGMFFNFDYTLPFAELQDTMNIIKVGSDAVTTFKFVIDPVLDVGGTLTVAASMLMTLKYHMYYRRRPKEGTLLEFSEDDQFFKLVLCLNIGYPGTPIQNGSCVYNNVMNPALFVLNSTDSRTIDDSVMLPFPESGAYYISMRLFCDNTICPCKTNFDDSKKYYVESDPNKWEAYKEASGLLDNKRVGVSGCTAMTKLTVSSMPCVRGSCSDHGYCLFTTSGGAVISSCDCTIGYGGWDCSDNSRMESPLLTVLLLTLSNLMFFLTIYVATIRKYYTEAVMYTFTMTLSTLYHACDAPLKVALCIVDGKLLQFGDFYCGIMSFWVTLLAMSIISKTLRSILQITGAVVVACLVTWNNEALLSFMLPVITGFIVVAFSWFVDYKRKPGLEYPRRYYMIYLPSGLIFVTVGLVCFALLQTEQNYKYVHSSWHFLIAVAVVCLLPDVKRSRKVNPFLPDYNSDKFWNIFRRLNDPRRP